MSSSLHEEGLNEYPPPPEEDPEEAEQAEWRAFRREAEFVITNRGLDVNPFLRQVIARRDGEQLMDDDARERELAERTVEIHCLSCGVHVRASEGADERAWVPVHICSLCGGRKRQAVLERAGFGELLRRRETRLAIRQGLREAPHAEPMKKSSEPELSDSEMDDLLDRVNLEPLAPEEPVTEDRLCPHCSKKLRADNTRGMCSNCWLSLGRKKTVPRVDQGDELEVKVVRRAPRAPKLDGDVEARFSTVVDALGLDRDEVMRELMDGWLAGLRTKLYGEQPGARG